MNDAKEDEGTPHDEKCEKGYCAMAPTAIMPLPPLPPGQRRDAQTVLAAGLDAATSAIAAAFKQATEKAIQEERIAARGLVAREKDRADEARTEMRRAIATANQARMELDVLNATRWFVPVSSGGSEENKKFYAATPSGTVEFTVSEAAKKSLNLDVVSIRRWLA